MIELSLAQFVALAGLSGAQLYLLFRILIRLGRVMLGQVDHETRITQLESHHEPGNPLVAAQARHRRAAPGH
jgi:hypothetical protein